MNLKKHVTLYQNKHLSCSYEVCIEVANIKWSQHPHMSSQHNKNMTTSHFDILSNISIIYKSHSSCLCIEIHVTLMFMINLIMDVRVRSE